MSISQMMESPQTATGSIADQVSASNLLGSAKASVKACSTLTVESATPEVRQLFQRFLQDYLREQEEITNLMVKRGWYHPFSSPDEQVRLDLQYASRADVLQ